MVGFWLTGQLIISFSVFLFTAHKVLAIELTHSLLVDPARQQNREIRALETRFGY